MHSHASTSINQKDELVLAFISDAMSYSSSDPAVTAIFSEFTGAVKVGTKEAITATLSGYC